MAAPSYFCPMLLSDPDRTARYREAIGAAVADFRRLNGRAPDVLDLGCGTGLLGLLAVEAEAATVVSVDLNETCVHMAERTMQHSGVNHWDVLHADELPEEQRFDMIVSEMLGTLCFGEQGFDVVAEYAPRLRDDVVGGPYVIPRTATQTVGLYAMPDDDDAPSWLRTALKEVLRTQVRWIGSNSLNLHPACLALRSLAPAQPIYAADYAAGSEETWDATFDALPTDALFVCEWTATLWNDVRLHNTMDAYRAMPLANAVGRECAWGFVLSAPPPLPRVVVAARRNDAGDFVVEARAGDLWACRDVKVAEDSSLAPLLDVEVGREVERSLDALAADAEVLIETGECAPMVRCLNEACAKRRLAEPWCQDDVAVSWTMRNPILRTGQPVDEPPDEGRLGLALLPDVRGECVTEAACRHNDDRFGPEKPTHVQVLEMMRSLGGDERTPTLPPHVPAQPLEWIDVELPVGGIKDELGEALAVCLSGPLRLLQGYASLTRHGMLGDDYMPGNYVQALPLLVRPCAPPQAGKRRKKAAAIRLRMATAAAVDHGGGETPLGELDPVRVRSVVAALCTGGAAVVLV